jgi:signal transduction histidine kinase
MAAEPPVRSPQTLVRRGLGITLLIGLALVFVIGIVFAVAYGSQQITRSATDLHKADETLRLATVVRAQVGMDVFMATVDNRFGTVSTEARATAAAEASEALDSLERGIEELKIDGVTAGTELEPLGAAFATDAVTTLNLLDAEDWIGAQQFANDELGPSFDAFLAEAVVIRDAIRVQVEANDDMLGTASNIARFLVAFFIPAAVIIVYRELVRRQQHEVELERRLAVERELAVSRDEFIANASHELRTPLTGIAGMAMLLEEDPVIQESELATELVSVIIGESHDLERMVEDLLTTARLDAGALQFTFSDVSVCTEVNEAAASMMRAGLDVAVDCKSASIRADQLRFRQIVRNLLSNAKKYGGPEVTVEGRVEGRTYRVSVSDSGEGLDPEVAANAFQRFVHRGRTTATKDSVGLGLSIVKSLAEGMGGSVGYRREGGWTTFDVRLPLAASARGTTPSFGVPDSQKPRAAAHTTDPF